MKTSELKDHALDWAVCAARGLTCFGAPEGRSEAFEFLLMHPDDPDLQYSTNWAQGGPIIDREGISVNAPANGVTIYKAKDGTPLWRANNAANVNGRGPTPLVAAMRCYVASKLGDEVEIPEELK
jgi:hypothetical protein